MKDVSRNNREVTLNDWVFNEIMIEDKKLFSRFIKNTQYPTNLWFSNFDFLWGSSGGGNRVLWKIVGGMLVIFRLSGTKYISIELLPLGKGNPDKLAAVTFKCLKFCDTFNQKSGKKTKLRILNELQLEFLKRSSCFEQYFKLQKQKGMDRHVSVTDLVALKGKKFEKVRNRLNRFKRDYPEFNIREALCTDYTALLNLKKVWNEKSGSKYPSVWDDFMYQRIIKHFQELNHIILIVEVNGEIAGMISGGILPHGDAWACESKYDNKFNGISEFLNVEFAKKINRLKPSTNLINLGPDGRGEGGLRAFKEKLRPVLDAPLYRLFLNNKG